MFSEWLFNESLLSPLNGMLAPVAGTPLLLCWSNLVPRAFPLAIRQGKSPGNEVVVGPHSFTWVERNDVE